MDATTTSVNTAEAPLAEHKPSSSATPATAAAANAKTVKPRRTRSAETPAAIEPWLTGAVEAIILSLSRPLPPSRLAEVLGEWRAKHSPSASSASAVEASPVEEQSEASFRVVSSAMVESAVDVLNAYYADSGRSFRIERVAGGLRMMTVSDFADVVAAFHQARASHRLSRPAVETLAIIAYKQPVTRAHLEAIRGVSCGEVLKSLLERQLVVVTGRAEELGRPLLYGTGPKFLTSFGLSSIKDLPTPEEGPGA
jgi:segregation and condensation protein B